MPKAGQRWPNDGLTITRDNGLVEVPAVAPAAPPGVMLVPTRRLHCKTQITADMLVDRAVFEAALNAEPEDDDVDGDARDDGSDDPFGWAHMGLDEAG